MTAESLLRIDSFGLWCLPAELVLVDFVVDSVVVGFVGRLFVGLIVARLESIVGADHSRNRILKIQLEKYYYF